MIAATIAAALAATQAVAAPPFAAGYQPQGVDERGLWMEVDEVERELKASNFIVRDSALNAYVRDVLCRTVGAERCAAARIYIVRTPFFNASMAPNGMMQLWTGLLLRARNEAQLAAVLAHEFAHFEARHSLRLFRDTRAKTDAMAWLSLLPYGVGLIGQAGAVGSVFANSREMEREADAASIGHLARAGYAPGEASAIWRQLRDEQDATAVERKRRSKKDRSGGFFATHPNSGERMIELARQAQAVAGAGAATGEIAYRTALAPWWAALIDDQVKLNDFGATDYLLGQLAGASGWTPELLYARGELHRARNKAGDMAMAAGFYRQALASGAAPIEVERGLGLALLRSGAVEEGRAALKRYAAASPDAPDRAMIAALAGVE